MKLAHGIAWACCCALSGCAVAPAPQSAEGPVRAAPLVISSPAATFERQQKERAQAAERKGQLAEAALAWEMLTVLRPDHAEYRDRLAETRRRVEAAAAERLQRAAQAQKRGELDAAAAQYLAVLALQPDHLQAADALRSIERERNKRNLLGKYSRLTIPRRAMAEAEVPGVLRNGSLGDRNEVEHAAMLARQGELDDAISLLEARMAANRRDAAARRLLADVYYQKGEKLAARDPSAAVAALEKSVRLDANHGRALSRLKQLKTASVGALTAPDPGMAGQQPR